MTRAPCSQHVPHESASVRAAPRGDVRTGGADACTLGGAKGARWELALCMLLMAVANARSSVAKDADWRTTWRLPTTKIELCSCLLDSQVALIELYRSGRQREAWTDVGGVGVGRRPRSERLCVTFFQILVSYISRIQKIIRNSSTVIRITIIILYVTRRRETNYGKSRKSGYCIHSVY